MVGTLLLETIMMRVLLVVRVISWGVCLVLMSLRSEMSWLCRLISRLWVSWWMCWALLVVIMLVLVRTDCSCLDLLVGPFSGELVSMTWL